jgi:acetyl-CoA C-acetyltransferase
MSAQVNDVVVVAAGRTPFGRFEGALKGLLAPQIGAAALNEVATRSGLKPALFDAVYAGVGMIGSAILTPVRQAVLLSNIPQETPSASIDRACCSGMTAIGIGMKDIRCGEAQAVLSGGFESLSNTPLLWPRLRARIGDVSSLDPLLMRGLMVDRPIPVYSGDEAVRHGVERAEQDEWAQQSHERYFAAEKRGFFDFERFAIEAPGAKGGTLTHVTTDESPRADSSLEALARLKPVYGGKTITAGNAPGLNDGAAFVALARRDFAQRHDIHPLARLVDYVQVCGSPTSGTVTPAEAIKRIAARNDRGPADWDLIEINEAYAATPLVSTLVLADMDRAQAERIRARTNVHGGAVAIGHPLGASGARIVMTLINGLRARGGGRGVAAICGGFGQGDALMIDVD